MAGKNSSLLTLRLKNDLHLPVLKCQYTVGHKKTLQQLEVQGNLLGAR